MKKFRMEGSRGEWIFLGIAGLLKEFIFFRPYMTLGHLSPPDSHPVIDH